MLIVFFLLEQKASAAQKTAPGVGVRIKTSNLQDDAP